MIFSAEWTYLLTTRKVGGAENVFSCVRIKYGNNATDTVSGIVVYPDDFSFSEAGVASMKFGIASPTQINATDWAALEEAGCIFLPLLGMHEAGNSGGMIEQANLLYWSATAVNASNAYALYSMYYGSMGIEYASSFVRHRRYGVRLVQDL